MTHIRTTFEVHLDLDPVPGAFHTPESARQHVQAILNANIPHYNPVVVNLEEELADAQAVMEQDWVPGTAILRNPEHIAQRDVREGFGDNRLEN